jgi:hypothetical protein
MAWREDLDITKLRVNRLFMRDTESGTATEVTASASELNQAADRSAKVTQAIAASGAVTAGVQGVTLTSSTTVIAATIADASLHAGLFFVLDTSATGTSAAHTVTLTSGTWDGTNNVATLNAPDEMLLVAFDGSGDGTVILNTGSVALST